MSDYTIHPLSEADVRPPTRKPRRRRGIINRLLHH